MELRQLKENEKRKYMDLLLLADDQEDMIERYLSEGEMYLLTDEGRALAEAVIKDKGLTRDGRAFEIMNFATTPIYQNQGHGAYLMKELMNLYHHRGDVMFVGTGDHPHTLHFYQKCGFTVCDRRKNFFVENYDHPIIDDGILLIDMVVLSRPL